MAFNPRRRQPARVARTLSPARFSISRSFNRFLNVLISALQSLELSFDPKITITRLQKHKWEFADTIYIFHATVWMFWLFLMPSFLAKIAIPVLYLPALRKHLPLSSNRSYSSLAVLPITSQFFLPALPVLTWAMTFFNSRWIPPEYRPSISVSVLPTLESVLYGANISDILTRFTHPFFDVLAWIPYGIVHFIGPILVAIPLWLFAPKGTLQFWAKVFGYMNITGVFTQIIFPCAAPCKCVPTSILTSLIS